MQTPQFVAQYCLWQKEGIDLVAPPCTRQVYVVIHVIVFCGKCV